MMIIGLMALLLAQVAPESSALPLALPEPVEASLPSLQSMFGEWKLAGRRGWSCTVTLRAYQWPDGLYSAAPTANCPDAMFNLARWRLDGAALVLADRNGKVLARLMAREERWMGDGIVLGRGR